MASRKVSFLELPWEIRDAVYSALLQSDERLPAEYGPPSFQGRAAVHPELTTGSLLCCNRQINEELTYKMKTWQRKGLNVYNLHVAEGRARESWRMWKRVPVPLKYIHTLQIDWEDPSHPHKFWIPFTATHMYGIISAFFEYGPLLGPPFKAKSWPPFKARFWPLIDTVVVNFWSLDRTGDQVLDDILLDDPASAPIGDTLQICVAQLLEPRYFNDLKNYLGHYIRILRVRCGRYIFERSMKPVYTEPQHENTLDF